MWTHRLRHWPNIVPTLGERLVFAGLYHITVVKNERSSFAGGTVSKAVAQP